MRTTLQVKGAHKQTPRAGMPAYIIIMENDYCLDCSEIADTEQKAHPCFQDFTLAVLQTICKLE